ncbi:hypothetical protein MNEG_13754 [Monoraphidium neglectum]|jgi:hypothetical protein|uniref:Uncharacterized protein n=1 Tax=Monoraphidium neglectum TaxID=145388 RepID=A0A0D2LRC2_9CHLO|nr:hypothetical protein MNEG_13754 [Monoraphidium neglectum]KIY94209.1 hypothetical protein MNEG_13754 [Monoraphidium neglectum]|eukprot:XP_013893229.1 hypothetical protein MNEG_13754 [Monoraphidium neglectum]
MARNGRVDPPASQADGTTGSGLIRFPSSAAGPGPASSGENDDPLLYGYSDPPSPIAEELPHDLDGGGGGTAGLARRAAAAWRRLVHGPQRPPRFRSGYLTLM